MRTIDPTILLAAMAKVHVAPPPPKPARARRPSYAPVTPPAVSARSAA